MKSTAVVYFTLASVEYTIPSKVSALICKGYCSAFQGFIDQKKYSPVSQILTYPSHIHSLFYIFLCSKPHKERSSINLSQTRKLRHRAW